MTWAIEFIVRLIQAGKRAYARKWSFLCIFVVVFFGTVAILAHFDLLPETSSVDSPVVTTSVMAPIVTMSTTAFASTTVAEFPTSIAIPAIRLAVNIENPDTTNISTLNNLLLKGAVRYPTSAMLNETGNVVIFGHSSYLPIVDDQAYKTFDGIQKLTSGDVITVYSSDKIYIYRVRSVAKENIANDMGINLAVPGQVLTLVTCNSFATKSDRFVVTADFVGSHSISS